jgi:predicted AAA+ superfamily ATPase
VFQELRAINDYLRAQYDIYFWRTTEGTEVDFVLHGPQGLIAIEVKRARSVHPADLKGLLAFRSEYPIAKLYLFYGGAEPLHREDIEILPISRALQSLPQLLTPAG